jgi:hypothetical protein
VYANRRLRWLLGVILPASIALLIVTLSGPRPKRKAQSLLVADSSSLVMAKDFGRGFAALMIEQYHAQSWSRVIVELDSGAGFKQVQHLGEALGLTVDIESIVVRRQNFKLVPYGDLIPASLRDAVENNWSPEVAAMFGASADLHWLLWQPSLAHRQVGHLGSEIIASYFKAWPRVSKRLNRRLIQLQISEQLSTRPIRKGSDRMERLADLDQALEERISRYGAPETLAED